MAASAVADAQTVDASAADVETPQETPAVDPQVEAEADTGATEATAETGEPADTSDFSRDRRRRCRAGRRSDARAAAPAEEPKPILLWRPARFDQRARQRPDHRQRGGQRQAAAAPGQQQSDERQAPEGRRDRGNGAGKPKFNRDRYKGPAKPQGEGGRPDRREGRGQDSKAERSQKPDFQSKPREERPAKVDPLSPFAKLAALRDQLKK